MSMNWGSANIVASVKHLKGNTRTSVVFEPMWSIDPADVARAVGIDQVLGRHLIPLGRSQELLPVSRARQRQRAQVPGAPGFQTGPSNRKCAKPLLVHVNDRS